jgi:hypothetical protein
MSWSDFDQQLGTTAGMVANPAGRWRDGPARHFDFFDGRWLA